METAQRIRNLPPYLFAQIDLKIAEAKANGVDVISLGIGDPDRPTPDHIVQSLIDQASNPMNHRYPSYEGLPEFRRAVADWYAARFGVELDPETETVSLIGSKEGIAHIPLCFVDPGDYVLCPDPGYPVYATGTLFAGGMAHFMPLKAQNGYLPVLSEIPEEIARKAKILFINYPNNPTAALANLEFFSELVEFAKEYDILVCHDAAYSEIYFDEPQPSFLQAPGAKEVGIEFHSVSKTFNMTGWRLGWAVGNSSAIEALGRLKTNIDSGIFQAIQYAGIEALKGSDEPVRVMRDLYRRRRDIVVGHLSKLGCPVSTPRASIYVWAPVPSGKSSTEFATELLDKAGVVVTPGIGYGGHGEGYFRISVCIEEDRIEEAFERITRAGVRW